MSILLNWLVSALVILVAAYLLPGIHVENFLTALVLALVLGILNAFLKPLLLVLTLPRRNMPRIPMMIKKNVIKSIV